MAIRKRKWICAPGSIRESNLGTVRVEIEVGPVCTFGPVRVEGNESISTRVIMREVTFFEGERFDLSKIESTRQRLFALDLFQFVDIAVEDTG